MVQFIEAKICHGPTSLGEKTLTLNLAIEDTIQLTKKVLHCGIQFTGNFSRNPITTLLLYTIIVHVISAEYNCVVTKL